MIALAFAKAAWRLTFAWSTNPSIEVAVISVIFTFFSASVEAATASNKAFILEPFLSKAWHGKRPSSRKSLRAEAG